jgi:hypothetical protein
MQTGVLWSGLMDSTALADRMPATKAEEVAHTVMRVANFILRGIVNLQARSTLVSAAEWASMHTPPQG